MGRRARASDAASAGDPALAPPPPPDPTGAAIRLRLLGAFALAIGGRSVPDGAWRLRKARSLVKLLALRADQHLPREQVMDLLWPDLEPDAAGNNLRGALHAARRVLAPGATIANQDGLLALRSEGPIWVDVVAFEEAAAAARGSHDIVDYLRALDLYTGELLPEDHYEDWTIAQRDRLRGLQLALLLECAARQEAAEDWPAAITTLQRVLGAEPAHEGAHTGLMRLYALAGQRSRALRQWDQFVAAMRRDLDAEPDHAARNLREEIAAGRFPPQHLGATETRRGRHQGNLPIPLTALIGREADLVAVKDALGRARLLTLTGAGGCGKTRLALAAATDLLAAYPGGVWLVELAALADPALVPRAIAGALGLREEVSRPLLDSTIARLGEQATLLVLDNCEHLRDACADLAAQLLAACPRLRLLATSRAALGLPGEVVWRVPSLGVPRDQVAVTPSRALADLAAVPAVRLFLERVRQRQPAFALTTGNAGPIAEIARRLDGIPLALELAAARVAVLPVTELAARLDDALQLLTGGSRAVAPRQRTLRATLDWSYDLLAEPQRLLLHRLSAFAGGASLPAIEAIGADRDATSGAGRAVPAIGRVSILDALGELAEHSLVQNDPDAAEARYHLLETVRQYAAERLEETGGHEATRRQHALYFLDLAERAEQALGGKEALAWLDRLETEHDNFRAALRWLHGARERERGLRLSAALVRFWYLRGHLREGRGWMEAFYPPDPDSDLRVQARAAYGLGTLAFFLADLSVSTNYFHDSVALWRDVGDQQGLAMAVNLLGVIGMDRGDYAQAMAYFAECLDLNRAIGDQHGTARTLHNQAAVARHQGNRQQARALYDEAIAIWRARGDLINTSTALLNLGQLLQELGDFARADEVLNESLALPGNKGNPANVAYALNSLGTGARERGHPERARQHHERALATFRELGNTTEIGRTLINLALVALDTAELPLAATLLAESLDLARANGHQRNTAHALLCLGDLAHRRGRPFEARDRYVEALRSFRTTGNPLGVAQALEHLGNLATAIGQSRPATMLVGASTARRARMETPLPPIDQADRPRLLKSLRADLGERDYADAWASGQALDDDEAIAVALALAPAVAPG